MAHTFRQKSQVNAQTGTSITHNHTPGAAATVIVLSIVVGGAVARTGGAPTIDGTVATQADIVRGTTGYQQLCETWYVCKAFSGAQVACVIPNSGALTCHIEAVSADAGTGNNSAFQSASGNAATGSNGFSINVTSAAVGDFLYSRLGCGENAPASITQTAGTPTKVSSYANDHGSYSSVGYYANADSVGTETFTYVWSNDDGCGNAVCFKSVVAPTVSIAAVNMSVSNPSGRF